MSRVPPDETKAKITEAARKLFVEKGYFNTCIPDIVKESGVSIGAIYYHFENKRALARHLCDETVRELLQGLEARLKGKRSTRQKLRAVVELLFDMAEQDPIRLQYTFFTKHDEVFEGPVPLCLSQPAAIVREILEEGMKLKQVRPGRPEIMAGAFTGIPLQIIELKLKGLIAYPLADVLEETFALCWGAISAN